MANLLCQHGYFFPVGECNKNLSVKDDSSLYRFQVRLFSLSPFNLDYSYCVVSTETGGIGLLLTWLAR